VLLFLQNLDLAKSAPNILLEKAYSHLKKSSVINFSQIITIDKSYFIKMICMLPNQFIEQIDKALLTIFDINIKTKRLRPSNSNLPLIS
jgi:mRNA interferase MazF